MTAMPISRQAAIWRAACEDSFWLFFAYGFGARYYCLDNPRDNWIYYPLHKPICDWIDGLVKQWEADCTAGRRRRTRFMLEIFRGGGKSTIGSALDLWLQVRNHELSEIVSSYHKNKSKEFLGVAKTTMEGTAKYGWFRNFWGTWQPASEERRWHMEAIVHNRRTNVGLRDYSMATSSVGQGLTGSRPDIFRLDDPIVKEKLTEEKNWPIKAREHLDASVYALKTNGLLPLYLTPYIEGDVADKVWHEEGVASVAGQQPPFKYKKNPSGWHVFYMPVRDLKTGRSVMPNVYPDDELARMEALDPDDFASQMMCNPASGAHMPLNMKDIEPLWVLPRHAPPNLEHSIHCDTAWKDKKSAGRGACNTIQDWGHDRATGKAYYLEGWHDRTWSPRDFMDVLVNHLRTLWISKNFPFVVTVDRASGGLKGSFELALFDACRRANLPCPPVLELDRTKAHKDGRIRQAIHYWKSGHVRLVRGAGAVSQLVYEMTHIGYIASPDMADAAADVFHPEVYVPAPGLGAGQQPPAAGRPFDAELWAAGSPLSIGDVDALYDAVERDEFLAFLQDRYT